MGILLERDKTDATSCQGVRERAAAGADFDDVVAGGECRVSDQLVGQVRPKEVLSETASLLVPPRPLLHGGGPSLRYP